MVIELSPTELMKQASMTAHDYLLAAIENIDKILGEGYAKQHPELIAAFMQTAARDFHTALMVKATEETCDRITDILSDIAENVRSDHPLQGCTLGGIEASLSEMAAAIQNVAAMMEADQ